MTPTPTQVARVQESFGAVNHVGRTAGHMFYARLFKIAPELREMFHGEPDRQAAKLMTMLAAIVDGLGDLAALRPIAADLAARHVAYGVTPAHYEPVGEALLWTLKQSLGDAFDAETEAAWETAYVALSLMMVESAYQKTKAAAPRTGAMQAAE